MSLQCRSDYLLANMVTYKNILIRETRPNVIEQIKFVIDYLYANNYSLYEVVVEIAELNGLIVYKTCLAEDDGRYIGITGEIPVELLPLILDIQKLQAKLNRILIAHR